VQLLLPLSTYEQIQEAYDLATGNCHIAEMLKSSLMPRLLPCCVPAVLKHACENKLMNVLDAYSYLEPELALSYAIDNAWVDAITKLSNAGVHWKLAGASFKIHRAE
jgi:hypothetical protein